MVFIGDSRVNQGLSPAVFSAELPGEGWTCRNFAFNAGGLTPAIFELAESRLNLKSSRQPIVVMNVSPGSLTLEETRNKHYEKLKQRSWLHAQAYIYFPRLMGIISREELDLEFELFAGQNDYYDDGWQAARRDFGLWPDAWIKIFQRLFKVDRIRPEIQRDLMDQVSAWTEKGILVVGFRSPISLRLREIENVEGKFNEDAFAKEFTAHGGIWIPVDATAYRTYDNSHLPKGEAAKFSRHLGRQVATLLADR